MKIDYVSYCKRDEAYTLSLAVDVLEKKINRQQQIDFLANIIGCYAARTTTGEMHALRNLLKEEITTDQQQPLSYYNKLLLKDLVQEQIDAGHQLDEWYQVIYFDPYSEDSGTILAIVPSNAFEGHDTLAGFLIYLNKEIAA